MAFIYVLWSEKLQKRYVGSTAYVESRLEEHNKGKTPYTKSGIPWVLLYKEEYSTVSEARKRELFLKSGVGREWLDKAIGKGSKSSIILN